MKLGLYHIQLMRYYEEVLAQAVRNYAFTGDKKWEMRYRAVEPMSDGLLKDAIANTDEKIKPFFIVMDKANMRLVKMEYGSIDLVNEGKKEQAIDLLESKEYADQRKVLAGGLEDFITKIESKTFSSDDLSDIMIPSVQQIIELERKLAVMEDNLKKEKLFAIGELSARLAHDIRNPLSVIKTSINILVSKGDVDAKTMEMYERMERAVERITYQIDDVLNFVKPRVSSLKNTSLDEILASVLARIEIPKTVVMTTPTKNIEFVGDIISLEIVFVNLITNALQAINNSGEITISADVQNEKIIIKIHDNGPGMPSDVVPKIFDPLFTTKQTGTGLGLTSCKTIIEQHGGHIEVESAVGKGTTFVVTLPYRRII
ncbi:sensor histidine kinase [Candidatus Nitrosotenuis chungbukensis]|uniref:sensor histidine kinase n=2 Tax=Candidatus Nitrosotenuis chungbukensis TaxID=1353246 RepID=UPI0006949B40|nr:ATP-binding protein [Candidatus Nitrosotenuis chungbukensis]